MKIKVKEMKLPSGTILETYEDTETGLRSTIIPAENFDEYGKEVVRQYKEAVAYFKSHNPFENVPFAPEND